VFLDLAPGSRLLGSKKLADYAQISPKFRSFTDTYTERSLIYAENVNDTGIVGSGVIDGQGAAFEGPYKVRPYMIRMIECRDVAVRDVRIENSPMWVQHYLACDGVYIRGITVRSRVNKNNDGIDIDCCRRVRISDCDIWSGDDAIVLKSTADRRCSDVVVTNCVISSHCNAFKLGTESNGGFENITFSNSTIYDTRLAGVAVECVDGGVLDGVAVSNITMRNVRGPIFIRLGDRARPFIEGGPKPGIGKLRNVTLQGIRASGGDRMGCSITGIPEQKVEHVVLRDVSLTFAGGGTKQDAERVVPENRDKYPEIHMFGTLPAYGFYCRHVKGLRFDNVRIDTMEPDVRPAIVCHDVDQLEVESAPVPVAS
jgi:polygalacturonase